MYPKKEFIAGILDMLCPICNKPLTAEGEHKKILVCWECGYYYEVDDD